jgi:hypothetical protein
MQVRPQWPLEGKLDVREGTALVATYNVGPGGPAPTAARRPYVYPLVGPDGVSLTELGKTHDPTGSHAHHYSLWVAHASVGGEDFWSERGGLLEHDGLERLEDGPVFCRIAVRIRWTKGGRSFLLERRELTFYASAGDARLVDLELTFRAPGAEAVELGRTSFGFLSVRVAPTLSVFDGGGEILNGAGGRNEQEAHLRRAPWIDLSGPVRPSARNGVAILDCPRNPRYPTAWHCRNDGWASASLTLEEPYRLEPGTELVLRYRLVLHRGDALEGAIATRHAEYAAEPRIVQGEAEEISPR